MNKELGRIVAVVVAILLLRIGLVGLFEEFGIRGGLNLFDAMGIILYNPFNLTLTLSTSLLLGYMVYRVEWLREHAFWRVVSWIAVVLWCATIAALIASYQKGFAMWGVEWYSLLFSATILCATILIVLYLWLWFRSSRRYVSKVLAKSERTQYQYSQLKRQLNPHFLFNSLSILDYLVQEQQTERASDYIKKLANIYRYLLKQEEYNTIELSKEVEFLHLYTDIMRERFLDGFDLDIDLTQADLSRKVVPCALQVLVENAFKHNTATPSTQLHIRIWSAEEKLFISNNINHKQSAPDSNGFGLRNLRTQYKMLANKEVEVLNDGANFTVNIPLL